MPSGSTCVCKNSSKALSENESNSDVDENLKPRGRHAVPRKKYKPNELTTTGFQCNYDTCDAMGAEGAQDSKQATDVQCDLEPDDDLASVCSFCTCTPGFCPPRCEMTKQKMGKHRSDSWRCPNSSGIPVAIKRNSLPGLGSLVVDTNTSCKCTGKCMRECEERKLKEAMEAMRTAIRKKPEKNTSQNGSTQSAQNQCRSACNTEIQTDVDESPVANLEPVPVVPDTPAVNTQPQSGASNVCSDCQCTGLCGIECILHKQDPTQVLTASDVMVSQMDTCLKCNCTGECNPVCQRDKIRKAQMSNVCDICKCHDICSKECTEKKAAMTKQNQTDVLTTTCHCETMCIAENDQIKETQTVPNEEPPKINQEVVCALCECDNFRAKKQQDSKPDSQALICNPCVCINMCHEECQATKMEVKKEIPEELIAEICECLESCQSKCAELILRIIKAMTDYGACEECNKQLNSESEPAKTCEVCNCTSPCPPECEAEKTKKEEERQLTSPELTENNKNGLESSKICVCLARGKSKSAPNCEIKPIVDSQPKNTAGDNCICEETRKLSITCNSAIGELPKSDKTNKTSIPCNTSKSNTLTSPEAKPIEPESTKRTSISININNPQCSSPKGSVQVPKEETRRSSADGRAVTACTSTPQGLISSNEFENRQSRGEVSKIDADVVEKCSGDQIQQECGKCLQLQSYIYSMFKNEDVSKTCAKDKQQESRACRCLENMALARNNEPSRKYQNDDDDGGRQCKCSKSIGENKSSYMDRMQDMLCHLQTSCEDAELVTTPFIKAASAFTLDVNNQQEAICALLQKCRQKDHYIDALVGDILERSKSKVFNNLICRLREQNPGAPDFDSALISSALDPHKKKGSVCGIDLAGFKICSVKRVGATSLLVKWTPPIDCRICGYDIHVNGQLKTRITNKERLYAILDALDFSGTIAIEIYAMAPKGRAYPSSLAYYTKC